MWLCFLLKRVQAKKTKVLHLLEKHPIEFFLSFLFFKYLKSYLYYKEYIHFSSLTLFFGNKASRIFCMYVFCCLLLVTDKWLNYKYNAGNISAKIMWHKLEGKWHPLNWYMKYLHQNVLGKKHLTPQSWYLWDIHKACLIYP